MKFLRKNSYASQLGEFSPIAEILEKYKKILLNCEVLVDIGVSDGRFIQGVENSLPKQIRKIGIDPVSDYAKRIEFERVEAVIGSVCTNLEFSISKDLFTSSKLYPGVRTVTVKQFRLECLLESLNVALGKSILLKIDTQGADIECLESAGRYLPYIQLAILEVQLKPFAKGMTYFSESIMKISQLGFEVVEFMNPINRALDQTLGQIDLIIFPKQKLFLESNEW